MQRVLIRNFKSLASVDLRLGSLTLLTGLNGAGKSSVIQALLSIRQSYRSGRLQKGELVVSGDLVDLGTPSDALFEGATEDELGISFVLGKEGHKINFDYFVEAGERIARSKSEWSDLSSIEKMLSGSTSAALLSGELKQVDDSPRLLAFHYLNAERHGPRKFLPVSLAETYQMGLGSRGEYVLDMLEIFQDSVSLEESDPRRLSAESDRLRAQLEAWLNLVSPGARLDITRVPDADLVLGTYSFGETGALRSRGFRTTNVGFGLSYVLPVLVALLATPPGGLVIIENPEAHLHPKGQTKIGELCARAAAAGVKVIIETHSDHLMDGARIAVKEGIAQASDVVFHYFTRTGSMTEVESPTIDDTGRLSSWPADFFDQHRRNTARLIKPQGK